MPFMLGLVIAIAVGSLAALAVPWIGRFRMATKRQYPNLERWLTCAAARPLAQEASAQASASRGESQGRFEAGPQHHGDSLLVNYDVAGEDGAWKVITFVCHMPRLSVEERQHLLAAWGDGHYGSFRAGTCQGH